MLVSKEESASNSCLPPDLAILMPDGNKVRLSRDVVEREHLKAGMRTPFTRLPIVLLNETAPSANEPS